MVNRIILNRISCMLTESGLDKTFRAEAAVTAVYLINFIPKKSLDYKTTEEIWSGNKPDIPHLRIFGCQAMGYIPEEKRKK